MLLLHTVLAVVYGGLLVSARPDLGRARGGEEAELTDNPYSHSQNEVVDDNVHYNWAPDAPQLVMDAAQVSYYAESEEVERPESHPWDGDFPRPPKVPNHFPKPPEQFPHPPEHPPEPPESPPHEPPHPGPPGPPPPGHPPGHPPHHPPAAPPNVTIYQFLESQPKFSRIFKLVNYTEDVTKLLNDSSVNVTFFALPDWGFPRPRHPHPPPKVGEFDFEEAFSSGDDIDDMLATAESLLSSNNVPNKDKLKAFIKFVLLYQTLPSRLSTFELGKNLTYPTSLTLSDGSLDGEPLRVRVGKALAPFSLAVNLFSHIVRPNIPTTNGLIHVVNKPVLPPPSAFQVTFLVPGAFSTLTSALQRVGLTDAVEWRNVEGGTVDGSPAVSFFAPTNKAFQKLPRDLRLFLFSPFGEKALKKLLQYHIVPEFVLHTNYLHNASDSDFVPAEYDAECGEFYGQLDYGEHDLAELHETPEHEDRKGARPINGEFKTGCGKISGWMPSHQCGSWPVQSYPEDSAYSQDGPQEWAYGSQRPPSHFPGNQYSYHGPQYSSNSYGRPDYSSYYSYDGPMAEGPASYEAYQDNYHPHFPSPGEGPHYPPPAPPFERQWPHYGAPPPPPYNHHGPWHHGPPLPPPFAHNGPPHYWPPPPPPCHWGPARWGPPPPYHSPPFSYHHGSPRCGPSPPPPSPFEHHEGPHGWGPHHPPPFPPYHHEGPHCSGPLPPPPFGHEIPHHGPHGPPPPPPYCGPHPPSFHCEGPPHPPPLHFPGHGPLPHCQPFPRPSPDEHGPHPHPPHHFPPHHPPPPPGAPPGAPNKKPHFPFPRLHIAYSLNLTAPTLLTNHSLDVHVVQFAHKLPLPWKKHAHYETVLFVHGVKVGLTDVPLRNGALHAIDKLLNPLKKPSGPHHPPHHHPHHPPTDEEAEAKSFVFEEKAEMEDDDWVGWQEWLPRWAEE